MHNHKRLANRVAYQRVTDLLLENNAENLLRKTCVSEVLDSEVLANFITSFYKENGVFPDEAVGKQNRIASRFDASCLEGLDRETMVI
jgi:hypothetical protein